MPPARPYSLADAFRDQREEAARTACAVGAASGYDPDAVARAQLQGAQLGWPWQTAYRNPQEAQKRILAGRHYQALQTAPATRRWLAARPGNAAVAHDQVEPLASLEQQIGDFLSNGRPQRLLGSGVANGAGATIAGLGNFQDSVTRTFWNRPLAAIGVKVEEPHYGRDMTALAQPLLRAGQETLPAKGDLIENLIYQGGSLGVSAAPALLDPALPAVAFAGQGAKSAHDKAVARHKDGTPQGDAAVLGDAALSAAASQAKIETLLGKPAAWLVGKLPAPLREDATARILGQLGLTGAGQAGLGAAQKAGENALFRATLDPGQDLGEDVGEQAKLNLFLGPLGDVVTGGLARSHAEAGRAEQIVEAARASPLRTRSPAAFADWMGHVADGHQVHVRAGAVRDYLKTAPAGDARRFLEASRLGDQLAGAPDDADLVLPAADYLAAAAATPAHAALKDDLRFDTQAMSPRQWRAFEAEYLAAVAAQKARAAAEAAPPLPVEAKRRRSGPAPSTTP